MEAEYLKELAVQMQMFSISLPCRGIYLIVLPYIDKRVFRIMCSPRIDIVARIFNGFRYMITHDHTGEFSGAYRRFIEKAGFRANMEPPHPKQKE